MKPLLLVIYDALRERGWKIEKSGYIDPEGNKHAGLEDAVFIQSLREIAQQSTE